MKLGRTQSTLMLAMIVIGGCVTTRGPAAPAYVPTSQPAGDVAAQSGLANAMAILKTVLDTTVRMEAAVNHIEATTRLDANVRATVGGKNDSVTAWLYGAAACLSWLAYPLVWRPLRNRLNHASGEKT